LLFKAKTGGVVTFSFFGSGETYLEAWTEEVDVLSAEATGPHGLLPVMVYRVDIHHVYLWDLEFDVGEGNCDGDMANKEAETDNDRIEGFVVESSIHYECEDDDE
jgi:hypothetical protein